MVDALNSQCRLSTFLSELRQLVHTTFLHLTQRAYFCSIRRFFYVLGQAIRTWPLGARYEGEFKSNLQHGQVSQSCSFSFSYTAVFLECILLGHELKVGFR